MSGWQNVFAELEQEDFVIIAAAQDVEGIKAAAPWYTAADATFVALADPTHRVSALYNLVNVPSAVWIDESGQVRRIDEGAYATVHKMGDFEFGRADYAPMVADWVARGEDSVHVAQSIEFEAQLESPEAARAVPAFRLGVYFKQRGDEARADTYWQMAQTLNPDSWNYHRQDWSYTPEEAGANWQEKVQNLGDKPYYKPVEGLDTPVE